MDTIRRNVRDLDNDERRLYEQAIGHELAENQQIIIQIISVDAGSQPPDNGTGKLPAGTLPAWCNVFEGLSDEDIADVERVALQRSDMTRPTE